jgi:hypothetical protein
VRRRRSRGAQHAIHPVQNRARFHRRDRQARCRAPSSRTRTRDRRRRRPR